MELLKDHDHNSDYSQSVSPQTDSHDPSFTSITPDTKFHSDQFHISNREHFNELPSTVGDSNFVRGENQHWPPDQVPAFHEKRARRKKNTQKPQVTIPPKILQPETQRKYPQQSLPHNSSTTLLRSNSSTNPI